MKSVQEKLEEALQTKQLTAITKALSEIANALAYELRPPYTEVLHFAARFENERYAIEFTAELSLQYSSSERQDEGLVFTVQFKGEAYADSPNPPIDELFYAGEVDSLLLYGYGTRWSGESIATPRKFSENLEVHSPSLVIIRLSDFIEQIAEMRY